MRPLAASGEDFSLRRLPEHQLRAPQAMQDRRDDKELCTGMFAFQDPVEGIVSKQLKDHMQEDSDLHLSGGGNIPVHTAEVLRQTKGAGLVEGGS